MKIIGTLPQEDWHGIHLCKTVGVGWVSSWAGEGWIALTIGRSVLQARVWRLCVAVKHFQPRVLQQGWHWPKNAEVPARKAPTP